MHVHSKICNLLDTQLNIGREISTAAFLDAILYAHRRGDFSKEVQNKLNNVLSRMIARRWMRDMPPWVEANLRAVLNHDFVWPDRIRSMIQDRSRLPKQLFYPDLDPERAWDIRLKIMVTENFDEASQICNSWLPDISQPDISQPRHFAAGHFAASHFAAGHFAARHFAAGRFAAGRFAASDNVRKSEFQVLRF
ncbi:hypothetical protein B9Z55_027644 [Caenorhabditis nigoni]|uniref:Uncharacterized protein n=1 Tax=Caenorhabditis nigoni TaxID=1611254 RepID=A0A2G5SF27_9PELO|nr:hypothetical protein B9Z55_027644 [Caenorhabditis nigoni]